MAPPNSISVTLVKETAWAARLLGERRVRARRKETERLKTQEGLEDDEGSKNTGGAPFKSWIPTRF
jgi:hypothetical protein